MLEWTQCTAHCKTIVLPIGINTHNMDASHLCDEPKLQITKILIRNIKIGGYSSVAEHPAAIRQVHGSTPCVP